jgi:hypothetical protein
LSVPEAKVFFEGIILKFLTTKSPLVSKVLFAKIVGGYDPNTEGENEAKFRALIFSAEITKAEIAYFQNAKVDLGASKLLKPNQIVLRLTLSPQ